MAVGSAAVAMAIVQRWHPEVAARLRSGGDDNNDDKIKCNGSGSVAAVIARWHGGAAVAVAGAWLRCWQRDDGRGNVAAGIAWWRQRGRAEGGGGLARQR